MAHSRSPFRQAVYALPVAHGIADSNLYAPAVRRLSLNESHALPGPAVREAVLTELQRVNCYPDSNSSSLINALAERCHCAAHRLIIGAGSEDLIQLIALATLEAGREAVMPAPSFPRYALTARLMGATAIAVPLRVDGANDARALAAAITPSTSLVWCCTPNNPTGQMLTAEEIGLLAATAPESALLVVDEAYHEYALHAGGPDAAVVLQRRRGPWVVLRSFSKAYGIAGLRLGYAITGSDEVAGMLGRVRPHFNTNRMAQAAALAALRDRATLQGLLDQTAAERARLSAQLATIGARAFPSAANFVSARLPVKADTVIARLRACGILIGAIPDPGYDDCIRITVGSSVDTDAVIAALKEQMQ